MENKDLKKNINIKLILAIFALVCFVGGVPMIVIFAKLLGNFDGHIWILWLAYIIYCIWQ